MTPQIILLQTSNYELIGNVCLTMVLIFYELVPAKMLYAGSIVNQCLFVQEILPWEPSSLPAKHLTLVPKKNNKILYQ